MQTSHDYMLDVSDGITSFDASVTVGDVTLSRADNGKWVIQAPSLVDLNQLDAVVQWAKSAPLVAEKPVTPVKIDGNSAPEVGLVDEARDLFEDQGGFGSTAGGGGPVISTSVVDVAKIRSRIEQMSFEELVQECEAACDDSEVRTSILEMLLEERVAKLFRDAAVEWGCFGATPEEIRQMTTYAAIQHLSSSPPDEFKWAYSQDRLMHVVDYLEGVRLHLAIKRRNAETSERTPIPDRPAPPGPSPLSMPPMNGSASV